MSECLRAFISFVEEDGSPRPLASPRVSPARMGLGGELNAPVIAGFAAMAWVV